jgi:hypothetical protein
VDDRLSAAVQNNARWCDLVCRSLGIPTAETASLWSALRRTPALYPDVITLSPGATDDDVVQAASPGRGCSVKDSFARLDLEKRGFEVLFEARWIYRPPMAQVATRPGTWTVIESEAELTDWSDAAGDFVAVPGDVLRDRTVRVLAATEPNGITGGAIANRTGSAVGVSNVFGNEVADPATWSAIGASIGSTFPSLPVVGYEHGDSLRAALESGFVEIGALRVWLHTSPEDAE